MKQADHNEKPVPSDGKSQALAISFGMFSLLAIIAISLNIWNAVESSNDAIAINLSGRQRMLSQRIEKNLLKLKYAGQVLSDNSTVLQELSQSYLLFDQTLSALGKGKLTDSHGNILKADSTQSKNAVSLIRQANTLWTPMQTALLPLISANNNLNFNAALKHALVVIIRDNQRLLQLMDKLTTEIETAAHKKSHYLRISEAFSIVLILINFGFVLFYFRRQLGLLSESKLLLMRIMEEVGTGIIVINEKGDIEQCNQAAEQLFKYNAGELSGRNLTDLLDKPYFMQTGKRTDGERFSLDINLNEIPATGHRTFVASLHDLTEQKRKEEQLSYLAYHDSLTGLPNRLLFMDRLAQSVARAHRNKEMTAVLFIDLDRFKPVNDTMGHATGDLLLQSVAARLMNCLREGDTLARIGGDEFTMIIDSNDASNCELVAHKILHELSREFNVNGHNIKISGSIGASLYPEDSKIIDDLLNHADIAMYLAKAKGGNTFCKFAELTPVPCQLQK
ncbi:MAG: diguanylate cyclase [Gallionellaceae bacterium]|jgi:diguanylate cyclase (GGDEF)-like protein